MTACRTRRRATLIIVALLAAASLVAAGCSGGDDASPTSSATAPATSVPAATEPPPPSATPTAAPTAVPSPVAPTPTPPVERAAIVRAGVTARRAIALTFDAGSDAGNTLAILATLREKGVRATFSVTGQWAETYPPELLAIAADGHPLMNHSYSHPSFTGASTNTPPLTTGERILEMQRTETTVYRMSNRSTRPFFRPPYGDIDDALPRDVALAGYEYIVMWNIDTLGWNGATADEIVARVRAQAAPDAIVVLHVGAASQDASALPELIDALRGDGYAFETVPEILAE